MAEYKVYTAIPDSRAYIGNVLFGAKNADEANKYIKEFNNNANIDWGFLLSPVDEDYALEDIYTHKRGFILAETIYAG